MVRPQLPSRVDLDLDNNRVDDRIDHGIGSLRRELAREKVLARREELAARLAAPVAVEVVFTQQVTQQQIDAFAAFGGIIRHLYRSVSYGWSGTIPGGSVDALAAAMGPSLLVVAQVSDAQLHMDEATRTGRVRPLWASGFAGSANGFSGTSDFTIGVVDTGVDDSHSDLAGRLEYWMDYTTDNEANPRDVRGHGSHVAGIALGTGAAFGAGPGTLNYTDSGNMTGLTKAPFSFVHPPSSFSYALNAIWNGKSGATATLSIGQRADGADPALGQILVNQATGATNLNVSGSTTGSGGYSSALSQNSSSNTTTYGITVAVSTYPGVGDGFNAFRGVAPGTRWAGAKVVTNAGALSTSALGAAMDDMVVQRSAHNIKIVNMSLGLTGAPGLDATLRAKANTMVSNGIVVVVSAGNDGPGIAGSNVVDDPGRASLVLTVGATNDGNRLTKYSSSGFASPGADEDMKPDLLAPGGSDFYSGMLSVDSNDADAGASGFADRVANDHLNIKGTSMSAPFTAGSAALVIDAMQKAGTSWTFSSSVQPLFVKMLLCASSTETNAVREVASGFNPGLGRAATPKDVYEGYGLMNPDAAVEAVSQAYSGGALGGTTAGGPFDRRAWGRRLGITTGPAVTLTLSVPSSADYDLYLYSASPDAKGNPVIRASSTSAGLDTDESITFTPTSSETRYLFIKRVSGSGDWSLSSATASDTCGDGSKTGGEQCDDGNLSGGDCCSADCTFESKGAPCNDGLHCTATDTCSSGVCSGTGNPCSTGAECNNSCNEIADNCASTAGTACSSDSNPCTVDQCNGSGSCSHTAGNAGTVCRAANGVCDVQETCPGTVTACPTDTFAGTATTCREANGICDVAEKCQGNGGACPVDTFASSTTACNDGLFCTADDRCAGGACVGSGNPCPGADGDANCAESCNEAGDSCTAADQNGSTCNDALFCNGTDACLAGACGVHAGNPCVGPDGDANCSESCDEGADTCTASDPNNSPCSDGQACTTEDACQAGACVAGQNNCGICGDASVNDGELCDDGNTANGDCCSSTCTPVSNGTACNDNQFCNGTDTCQSGACTQHAGNPCPGADGDGDCSETCDEAAGACSGNDSDASACDDGLYCNGADTCRNGICSQHGTDPCAGADGDDDCSESCNENADDCTAPDTAGSPCNDGVFCNGADTCNAGSCSIHGPVPCVGADGDGNCAESCDEANDNCAAADLNGSACNDAAFCNGADTCSNGVCSQHAGSPCPGADGDMDCAESCNEGGDACDAEDPNGSICTDGEPCTVNDSCQGGACSGDASVTGECTPTTTTTLPGAMCGDTNGDGEITASDALFTLRSAVGSVGCLEEICDYNGDGTILANDAQSVLRSAVGQDVPPNCPPAGGALEFVTSTVPVTTTTWPESR